MRAAEYNRCVARIRAAAGREINDDEIADIVEQVQKAASRLRRGENANVQTHAGDTIDTLATKIAEEAARAHVHAAERHERNTTLQTQALALRLTEINAAADAGLSRLDALSRLIANRADGRMNAESIEQRALGVESALKRNLGATWDALGSDYLGFLQNTDKIRLLIRELRGENTGDAKARNAAASWKFTADAARRMFNDAGGDVGQLENWGFPQHHSQEKVAAAGRQPWINAVLPSLDRAKYIDDFGRAWDDARLSEFLSHAWDTIATNGYANVEPGRSMGRGMVGNRHAEERQIHFNSADAYMNYWAHFGEKTFPQILEGHIAVLARDIALTERFGPNPDVTYRTLRDVALRGEAMAGPTGLHTAERDAVRADNLWSIASGRTTPIANRAIAGAFDVLRSLNVAAKLGSAFWASFYGDKVMLETMSHLNGLPAMQRWYNEMRLLTPAKLEERNELRRQGLMLEYTRTAISRFGEELGSSGIAGKLANAVMRVSGMNAINEFRRGAFGLSLMDALGRSVESKAFHEVDPTEMHLLTSYGINERDWSIWKLAKLEDYGHGNDRMLTPDTIARISDEELRAAGVIAQVDGPVEAARARQDAVVKLLGAINSESRVAIVEPGWRERAQLYAGLERGTMKGEVIRAFWQFKSFPIAQLERAWDVAMSRPTFGGKAGVLAGVMVMQTLTARCCFKRARCSRARIRVRWIGSSASHHSCRAARSASTAISSTASTRRATGAGCSKPPRVRRSARPSSSSRPRSTPRARPRKGKKRICRRSTSRSRRGSCPRITCGTRRRPSIT
jgi:hypothetical protein